MGFRVGASSLGCGIQFLNLKHTFFIPANGTAKNQLCLCQHPLNPEPSKPLVPENASLRAYTQTHLFIFASVRTDKVGMCVPYTPHPSPETSHPTPCTLHPSPRIVNSTPDTPHPTLYTLHSTPAPYSLNFFLSSRAVEPTRWGCASPTPFTLHLTPYTLHPTPCTLHPAPCTQQPEPCTLHPAPYTRHPALHTLQRTPDTRHPAVCTLQPTLYTLHPAPCTLHSSPYTLHPTPHILQSTPHTLHPTPPTLSIFASGRSDKVGLRFRAKPHFVLVFGGASIAGLAAGFTCTMPFA